MAQTSEQWWVALVTFERGPQPQDILPKEYQGASGWMACLASHETDEDAITHQIETALSAVGLNAREIERVTPVWDSEDVEAFDECLAQNMERLEPNKTVVWGTTSLPDRCLRRGITSRQ
jgi:hypothetical protein